jgi:hypothetical protein
MLLNPDVVAVNQDLAALPPFLASQQPPPGPSLKSEQIRSQVFARPLSGGRIAALLLNRANATANLSVGWSELRLPLASIYRVYNVHKRQWTGRACGLLASLVPSHDVLFVILAPYGV